MARLTQNPLEEMLSPIIGLFKTPDVEAVTGGTEFWRAPDRCGWLLKQGDMLRNWRRRWFVLKDGKIFWFKTDSISALSLPRGVIEVKHCLSVKGAEEVLNKPFAFELSTQNDTMYFIAESDKEKEDWINSVGRAIVRHSRSLCEESGAGNGY